MTAHLNGLWAESVVRELRRHGIHHFCITPGSRSAPLVLAVEDSPDARIWSHLDERSSAFFALGIGKATGVPAVVITTSGTAVANLHPAVVEAAQSGTPLILLTADRPPALRGCGAPQTIDQPGIFGDYTRWSFDAPLPTDDDEALAMLISLATLAARRSLSPQPGPTHLNLPFDEPLVPPRDELRSAAIGEMIERVARRPAPRDTNDADHRHIPAEVTQDVARRIAGRERGLILCGEIRPLSFAAPSIAALAAQLGWPIVADIASQLRFGSHNRSNVITTHDALLRSEGLCGSHKPDCILQLGGAIASKALYHTLGSTDDLDWIAINERGLRIDPNRQIRTQLHGDIAAFCEAVIAALPARGRVNGAWLSEWQTADRTARRVARDMLPELVEGAAATAAIEAAPDDALCFLSNSMPIRDADSFAFGRDKPLHVLANRGANGIDGIVSTALGACAGTGRPLLLLTGDLALLHDMNGLLAARRYELPVLICVIHNDGGGIFHFLPIADRDDEMFETHFGTPHGLDIAQVARLYDLPHSLTDSHGTLGQHVREAFAAGGPSIVEYRSDRRTNATAHRRYWQAVDRALKREGLC